MVVDMYQTNIGHWLGCGVEHSGSGVGHRTLDYENPGSNPVLRH